MIHQYYITAASTCILLPPYPYRIMINQYYMIWKRNLKKKNIYKVGVGEKIVKCS